MPYEPWTHYLADARAQEALGARLAGLCPRRCLIFLAGDLGVGKTTLVRGMLQGLGHRGTVKSPTYTLIEPYQLDGRQAYHLDLYRLADPEELDYLGLREILAESALVCIEWPERGQGWLPSPDLQLDLRHQGAGRVLQAQAGSPAGAAVLAALVQEGGAAADRSGTPESE